MSNMIIKLVIYEIIDLIISFSEFMLKLKLNIGKTFLIKNLAKS
jgi:hypothetical protein